MVAVGELMLDGGDDGEVIYNVTRLQTRSKHPVPRLMTATSPALGPCKGALAVSLPARPV